MRARMIAVAAAVLLLGVLVGLAGTPQNARARLQEATPAPGPAIVTLVAWYQPDPSGDFLQIGPITINQFQVAGAGGSDSPGLTGRANFNDPDNNDLPRITLGDSVFDAYPLNPDDPDTVFRWLYFNDEQGSRPATLVMQIEAKEGPYKGSFGTATFVSRASESGGVLVIVLNPPAEGE